MLKNLSIKNYALIDALEIDFNAGLSVISGETGAGKSILLGALALVLGQRADSKSIRNGESKCVVEAVFDVKAYNLKNLFEVYDWEYDNECTLRREALSNGKSRAFINDSPVGLNDLKLLGDQLIDIHSQHRNLLLNDNSFQLQAVDLLAGHTEAVADYRSVFQNYLELKRQLKSLKQDFEQGRKEEDYIRFQYEQLAALNLQEGEQPPLESEQDMLANAEEIKAALYKADALLSDDERGAITILKETAGILKNTGKLYVRLDELTERINSLYIDLKDISSDISALNDAVEYNPERLLWVQERLNALYSLEQKHHVNSADELLQLKDEFARQLSAITNGEEEITALEKEIGGIEKQLNEKAAALSKKRKEAAAEFEQNLTARLLLLGMPNAAFRCEITDMEILGNTGKDKITFLFSANKNQPLRPVADIASGGEISRFMLAVKSLIAGKTALPSIIFDEIDTGVSGEIADKMGAMMQELGKTMQVISISHLPQIAARGKYHYLVYKEDTEVETLTKIRQLAHEERVMELARMLSGASLTDAAIANARQLLQGS